MKGFADSTRMKMQGKQEPKRVFVSPHYRDGGKVHDDAKADKKMIDAAIRKHVNTPAPKGHKGLKKEY